MRAEPHLIPVAGVLLLIGILAACDFGPTEPRAADPADVAVLFTQLSPGDDVGDGPVVAECAAGGTITFEMDRSLETEGDLIIRHTRMVRRYEDCGMSRGTDVITANGEMSMTMESHLEDEDAQWLNGVLYQRSHEVGTLTMTYENGQSHGCEFDFVTILEPAKGRYSVKGTRCGHRIDSHGFLQVTG